MYIPFEVPEATWAFLTVAVGSLLAYMQARAQMRRCARSRSKCTFPDFKTAETA